MFTALTDPAFDIANTHVIYGSTAHPKLQKKFVMKHLKAHQVHEYSYTQCAKGVEKVEVAYHGGINTPPHTTTETFKTSEVRYQQWIKDANFKVVPWVMERIHGCRSQKIMVHKDKLTAATITPLKKNYGKVSHSKRQSFIMHTNGQPSIMKVMERLRRHIKSCRKIVKPTHKMKIETKGWPGRSSLPK